MNELYKICKKYGYIILCVHWYVPVILILFFVISLSIICLHSVGEKGQFPVIQVRQHAFHKLFIYKRKIMLPSF